MRVPLSVSGSVILDGWQAQSGSVNAPAAFSDVLFLTVPPGTYTVNWTVSLSGTPGAGDANNFRLIANSLVVATSVNAGAAGSYPQAPVTVTLAPGAGNLKVGTAGNAGTAGSVYGASVPVTGGRGQVQLGPQLAGVSWSPANVGIVVTPVSTTVVSTFKLYNGGPADQNFIGGTYTGDVNSSPVSVPDMHPGAVLTGVWSGGNPGAKATMTITGTQNIPGGPA